MKKIMAVLLFGFFVSGAQAAMEDTIPPQVAKAGRYVRMNINGLACPFCLYGIQKQLKKLKGVADLEASFEKSEATLWIRPASSTTIWDLSEAVRKAGFTAVSFHLTDVGRVRREEEGWIFISMTNGEQFNLESDSVSRQTDEMTRIGAEFVTGSLRGTVREAVKGTAGLSVLWVEDFMIISPKEGVK
ncbi:heavy-metal-associated domain-containing protein [bacterium]|nr:heavy-metal-associated domain-containing protein [bacterium]